jgi:Ca2+-binding RTX toxin-like protein
MTAFDDILRGIRIDNQVTGTPSNDTLTGGAANDLIRGLQGDDTLSGGDGDDILWGDVEYSTYAGDYGSDYLLGGPGNDVLIPGTRLFGGNIAEGGPGNDTYLIGGTAANAWDGVVELPGEGTDTVFADTWYCDLESLGLNSEIENLTLLGNSGTNAYGNALNNVLTGNAGDNFLNGRAGADTLAGGPGNDSYAVDDPGDQVVELAGQGRDTVYSQLSYTLPDNVEVLFLDGTGDLDAYGNALDNGLVGNSGVNLLAGGPGNDTYYSPDASDTVLELSNEGLDTIEIATSFTLPANVERLILTGSDDSTGTGNRLDNVITGNPGINELDGSRGWDNLAGGAGNDTYWVDQADDKLTEAGNAGTDEVHAQVSFTLGANLENLILGDSAGNLDGTGNALDNLLTGNAGSNTLAGGEGKDTLYGLGGDDVLMGGGSDDTLAGGFGQDLLVGGAGSDHFVFDTSPAIGGNADVIADFTKGQDKLVLALDIYTALPGSGILGAEYFHTALDVTAQDGNDFILYDVATGQLFYDPDGSGFDQAMLLAILTGGQKIMSVDIGIAE